VSRLNQRPALLITLALLVLAGGIPLATWVALESPEGVVLGSEQTREFLAVPEPGPEGHARIRARMREKYGVADWGVGLFQDTSPSVATRLRSTRPDRSLRPKSGR
jgi:hypothetical protein